MLGWMNTSKANPALAVYSLENPTLLQDHKCLISESLLSRPGWLLQANRDTAGQTPARGPQPEVATGTLVPHSHWHCGGDHMTSSFGSTTPVSLHVSEPKLHHVK